MKGNVAIAEAAVQAGCKCFFGYPITPQNEIPEYLSKRLPEVGGTFLQAESEVAAINMVYGASGAGVRVMTSSSSPGISLKAEGISYIAAAELPCVIVNIVRGGPGLGGIQAAQSDYFQATKGCAHGDFYLVVYAPSTTQEAFDLTYNAFEIADKYRTPVMILGDGILGNVMEPLCYDANKKPELYKKDWATVGCDGTRKPNIINTLYLEAEKLEERVRELFKKYEIIKEKEVLFEEYNCDEAEIIIAAYGTSARIAKESISMAREQGIKVGLLRPITLWPFPKNVFYHYACKNNVRAFLTVEMSMGQMVEDVRTSVEFKKPVFFFGRTGGVIPSPKEIFDRIKAIKNEMECGGSINGCNI